MRKQPPVPKTDPSSRAVPAAIIKAQKQSRHPGIRIRMTGAPTAIPIGKHALIAMQPPPKMRMTSENGDAWILTLRKGKSSPHALAPFAVMRSGVFFPLHISASIPPTRAQSHRSRRQRGKTAIRASRTRRPKEKAKACLHPPETKARGACSCFWQLRQGRRARRAAQDGGCAIFGADASLHSARQPNGFRRVP